MSESPPDSDLEAILDYLNRSRGCDFRGYKRASLHRRISKRMHEAGVTDLAAYVDYLEVHPGEFTLLFNTILINVTSFFRDPECWEFLASDVLPELPAAKSSDDPIRIWSAGCASGQEAYSIAILLAEALGVSEFRRRVKIYATDIDEEALDEARRASYSTADLEPLSKERRERFFQPSGDRFVFRPELRRSVIFGRHDLVRDPPMSRLDLIVCRNVLMYLNAQTQAAVLTRLHFALSPAGVLFLGRAEMLLSHTDLFAPVELRHRIFSRIPANPRRDQLVALAQAGNPVAEDPLAGELGLRAGAFDALAAAQLVVDGQGNLALANGRARKLFGLQETDLGRPLQDLELSYRPVELRSMIDRAYQEGRLVSAADIEHVVGEETRVFEVQVSPLLRNGEPVVGASVLFLDQTVQRALRSELDETNAQLEQANQAYHSTNEELETTNEELQSTNEELETTNEELQSSNEELETMNEELQATNEELRSMNDMLQEQSRKVSDSNAFLESILTGLGAACIVVDANLVVRVWKEKAEELWGVREDEAEGQSLLSLDIGLPVSELEADVLACIQGAPGIPSRTVDAINRRGQPIRCIARMTPLRDIVGKVQGAILLLEPIQDGRA
jgi:two-component system CheB/CheR fusion protein